LVGAKVHPRSVALRLRTRTVPGAQRLPAPDRSGSRDMGERMGQGHQTSTAGACTTPDPVGLPATVNNPSREEAPWASTTGQQHGKGAGNADWLRWHEEAQLWLSMSGVGGATGGALRLERVHCMFPECRGDWGSCFQRRKGEGQGVIRGCVPWDAAE
jgi:hypothetical protein